MLTLPHYVVCGVLGRTKSKFLSLSKEVLPSIEAKKISGYKKIEVLRIELENEVEFITIMTFESLKNVIDFQGDDYKKCYVSDVAQKVLKRWDQESTHYEWYQAAL